MNTIKAIAIKSKPHEAMQELDTAQVSVERGVVGDFRGAQPGRQVTILSETQWQKACAEVGTELPWTTRRANLLLDGIEFDASFVGKTVRIGEVVLEVTEETNPCSRMDAQHRGLTAALTPEWRGGICCNVIKPGNISIGDHVEFT